MKKIIFPFILLASNLLIVTAADATIPNAGSPNIYLGPTLRGAFTNTITDSTAYSLAGEAGFKNFRVSATAGWYMCPEQRVKLSAEYLWQNITYAYFAENTDRWVSQGALGASYEYDFLGDNYNPQFDLSGYAAHALSQSLSELTGVFTNSAGLTEGYIDHRRIGDSNALGFSPGISIQPWMGGTLSVLLDYDDVQYKTNSSPGEDAIGLGGTISVNQALSDAVSLGLSAADRQPFNHYAGNLTWSNLANNGNWMFGLFAEYTTGKYTLPSTYDIGVSIDYLLDGRNISTEHSWNPKEEFEAPPRFNDNLTTWTAVPAVYMPQVLTIPDEAVTLLVAD